MPLPLSYPGIKCILENLEAVKRAHIIARSPGLQKINKLIPICSENLTIACNNLTINKLLIEYDKDEVKFEMNGRRLRRHVSDSQENAMKKLINFYICGRSIARVDKLYWFPRLHPNLMPVNLKIRVNSLEPFFDFETAIPFIDPRSFPLKTVVAILEDSTLFDNQVVKLAKSLILILIHYQRVTVEDLKKLNNNTVEFNRDYHSRIDIIQFIKYQIETKKATETTFVISADSKFVMDRMLSEFELAFGDFRLDGVIERFLPESSGFSIPINNNSRVHAYATEKSPYGGCKLIVKPVS
ncbi:hypothetical protein GCK72_007874 [Caenorhabditis remanei]|uniref:DUF38 domain-containing protein n=1 Tax=Caenorhabditis remanei TaxID=31234 RepID=A0A6A5HMT6_CAERE|nr:hypothetical protein GCK72_007874 [Caenorhabditis remanei]KAF1767914.1 hypothetical protein GCK72_007874 [Caenorhabditis remanei]